MSLITTGPSRAASSRRANDHSDQSALSVTRSSNTLVSTKVTSAFASCHGHDLVGAQTLPCMPTQPREPARTSFPIDFDQNDSAVCATLKVHLASRSDAQKVANALRNGDLALA